MIVRIEASTISEVTLGICAKTLRRKWVLQTPTVNPPGDGAFRQVVEKGHRELTGKRPVCDRGRAEIRRSVRRSQLPCAAPGRRRRRLASSATQLASTWQRCPSAPGGSVARARRGPGGTLSLPTERS